MPDVPRMTLRSPLRAVAWTLLLLAALAAATATPLVALGEHRLRGIAAPCEVFTLPDAQ